MRRGCSFHGLALNVDMDMEPFQRINPCGYAGLRMVQMRELVAGTLLFETVEQQLTQALRERLGYSLV